MTTVEKSERRIGRSAAEAIDAPEVAELILRTGDTTVPLSKIEYWQESPDEFVVRSREFDCVASGPSLTAAVESFMENLFGYAMVLDQLREDGRISELEEHAQRQLSERLLRFLIAERRGQRRRSAWRRVFGRSSESPALDLKIATSSRADG